MGGLGGVGGGMGGGVGASNAPQSPTSTSSSPRALAAPGLSLPNDWERIIEKVPYCCTVLPSCLILYCMLYSAATLYCCTLLLYCHATPYYCCTV
jgi:hypothetical protein